MKVTTGIALWCFTLASLLGYGATQVSAEGLEQYVPAEYELTIRIDARQFFEKPEMEDLRKVLLGHDAQAMIAHIREATGIDLEQQLNEATLAGYFDESRESDGLLLLRGNWRQEDVLKMFESNPEFEQIGDYDALYRFWSQDDNEIRYLGFLDSNTLVLGRRDPVQSVLKRMDADMGRLVHTAAFKQRLEAMPDDAVIRLVARVPQNAIQEEPLAEMAQSLNAVALAVSVDGQTSILAEIGTEDTEAAGLWREMAEGGLAFVQMAGQFEAFADLARAAELSSRGSVLRGEVQLPMAQAYDILAMHPALASLRKR